MTPAVPLPGPPGPLYRPFRPRRARRTAWGVAGAQAVVLVGLAVLMPADGVMGFRWYDRLGVVLVAAATAGVLSRFALTSAVPDADGLVVRNLLQSRRLAWAEVVAVRFGGGGPWATLDLADGESVAVMAVQRADGDAGRAEARRLATLVALRSATDPAD